jgi:phosphatidylinositol alpha-1,6-mannosyltransferase
VALARTELAEFTWCGNLKPAAYPARWVAARVGVPYGVLVHGGDLLLLQQQIRRSAFKRRTARLLLGSASVLVANSHWTSDLCRRVLSDLKLDFTPDRVRVVPLGADPEQFQPNLGASAMQERYDLDGGRWLITVARLTQHKGIDTGIRVLARLRGRYPDLGYAVVGSGGDLPRLQAIAQELGVSDRVRFLSNVPDADLPALYNCAGIYLGLSRQMEGNVEGFGISLVEAGACGLPVVGGRSGGIPDAVRDGETGLLVSAAGPDEAAAAVSRLLDDKMLAQRLGVGGRQAVETYYNWNRVAAELQGIGQEVTVKLAPGVHL